MKPGVYLWRGQTYIGQAAVAQAAGVTPPCVAYQLERYGNLDRLGRGRGGHRNKASASKPITVGGQSYPSIKAFAGAVGLPHLKAQRWVREGRWDRLLAALMAADASKTRAALKDADMIDRFGKKAA